MQGHSLDPVDLTDLPPERLVEHSVARRQQLATIRSFEL
jgi:hypothetical protein